MSDVMRNDVEAFQDVYSDDYERYEIINGEKCSMGSPASYHQSIVSALHLQIGKYLEEKPCRVFPAAAVNLTNALFNSKNIIDISKTHRYIPDIVVICDDTYDEFGDYSGVPSLVIEVASESMLFRDFTVKRKSYMAAKVKEYLIIIDASHVISYTLKDGKYTSASYLSDNGILKVPLSVFPDMEIILNEKEINRLVVVR